MTELVPIIWTHGAQIKQAVILTSGLIDRCVHSTIPTNMDYVSVDLGFFPMIWYVSAFLYVITRDLGRSLNRRILPRLIPRQSRAVRLEGWNHHFWITEHSAITHGRRGPTILDLHTVDACSRRLKGLIPRPHI